jgi:uncharacterized protein YehS (DUF1456 family)
MNPNSILPSLRAALAAAALALAAAPAADAITLENYQKYRLDSRNVQATFKSLLEVRMEGVLHGLVMANRGVEQSGGRPLFCAPANLQMRGPDVLKMLDTELTTGVGADGKPYPGSTQIEDVLLALAQKRWPCRR